MIHLCNIFIMKFLVVGIDGGDERIMNHFNMPFFRSLFKDSKSYDLNEDRWSRGWAEMYTGEHARESGAFYELPELDGTMRFHRRYSWEKAAENPIVKYLWDRLDEEGISSVFMNIPTTYPAPKIQHGRFISGAGGGLNNVKTIPDDLCSDAETKKILEKMNYVVDLRYATSGIKILEELFEKLNDMMLKRAEAFVAICNKDRSDFGFIAFRATTIIQYIAMSEIEHLIESGKTKGGGGNCDDRAIHQLLREHYSVLDGVLKLIWDSLNPERYILTADHGCVPFMNKVNLNHFLTTNNLQEQASCSAKFKKMLWRLLPRKQFEALKKIVPKAALKRSQGYVSSKTKAFGNTNIHGLYINDTKRFGGIIEDGEKLNDAVDQICDLLNNSILAKDHRMKAFPYRRKYPDAFFYDSLPDIWVDMSENYFPESGPTVVTTNDLYGPITALENVPTDMNSGQKGSNPLFVIDAETAKDFELASTNDLTVVYKLIVKYFSL